MSERRNVFEIACVYSGTVLGAGFATGQELVRYFLRFGEVGILGIIISGILFAMVGYKVLYISYTRGIGTYTEFAEYILGKRLSCAMEAVVALFLMVLFSTMLAASGSALNEVFCIPVVYGAIISALLCFLTFLYRIEGLVKINTILCPILIVGGMAIGLVMYFSDSVEVATVFGVIKDNIWVSILVYVSYNIITAVSLLVTMAEKVRSRGTALKSGIIGGGAMAILGVCIALPIMKYYEVVGDSGLPMLSLVIKNSGVFRYGYIVILFAAIFTTAVGNGFALIQWLESRIRLKGAMVGAIVCIGGVILSSIGFVGLVGKVYMIFGYAGLIELFIIIFKKTKIC